MPLWEIDTSVAGYDNIRHTYVVKAKTMKEARAKAHTKFRKWLDAHAKIAWARKAEIVR